MRNNNYRLFFSIPPLPLGGWCYCCRYCHYLILFVATAPSQMSGFFPYIASSVKFLMYILHVIYTIIVLNLYFRTLIATIFWRSLQPRHLTNDGRLSVCMVSNYPPRICHDFLSCNLGGSLRPWQRDLNDFFSGTLRKVETSPHLGRLVHGLLFLRRAVLNHRSCRVHQLSMTQRLQLPRSCLHLLRPAYQLQHNGGRCRMPNTECRKPWPPGLIANDLRFIHASSNFANFNHYDVSVCLCVAFP